MEEKVHKLNRYKAFSNASLTVWLFSFVLVGISFRILMESGDIPVLLWLSIGLWVLSCIMFIRFSNRRSRLERELADEIVPTFERPLDARDYLLTLGVRRRFADFFLKEDLRLYQEREDSARREAITATAVLRCKEVLGETKKPKNCNEVYLEEANDFFDDLENYQAKTTWEVWRSGEQIYFYASQIKGYPSYSAQGPYAFAVNLSDIQYYRVIGSVKNEVQISGGTVKQDKRTGRVTQTPLKTRTVEHDERLCNLTLRKNGVVSHLLFDAEDFDVFFALIPEKSYTKVTGGGN